MSVKFHTYLISEIAAITVDSTGVARSAKIKELATKVEISPDEHDHVLSALEQKNSEVWSSADETPPADIGDIMANLSIAAEGVNAQIAEHKAKQAAIAELVAHPPQDDANSQRLRAHG